MADDNPDDTALPHVICPYCGQEIAVQWQMGQMPRCPSCGEAFVVNDETDDAVDKAVKDAELSSLRIMQLSRQRRGLIRTRSYMLVLTIASLVMAIQLAISMLRLGVNRDNWLPGERTRSTMFMALMAAWFVISLILVRWFGRKASDLKKQVFHSDLSEPTTPPDYSALSDGSQHARALEQMTRPRPDDGKNAPPPPQT